MQPASTIAPRRSSLKKGETAPRFREHAGKQRGMHAWLEGVVAML